ncbi:hypothetical protein J6590_072266 [Homalodisca vitripennis]|nr:hypothetical protein J6590_072266 [Homalodisca vitripennis]
MVLNNYAETIDTDSNAGNNKAKELLLKDLAGKLAGATSKDLGDQGEDRQSSGRFNGERNKSGVRVGVFECGAG